MTMKYITNEIPKTYNILKSTTSFALRLHDVTRPLGGASALADRAELIYYAPLAYATY